MVRLPRDSLPAETTSAADASLVMYAAMPAAAGRASNHVGVPYTWNVTTCESLFARVEMSVAVEPVGSAVSNHEDGTLT